MTKRTSIRVGGSIIAGGNVTISGSNLKINGDVRSVRVENGKVWINERLMEGDDIEKLMEHPEISISVTGNVERIETSGDVEVSGEVTNGIKAQGKVQCGTVTGSVKTQGAVEVKGDVGGSIKTQGRVDVGGTVGGHIKTLSKVSYRKG